jgi:hypothetical protein
MKKAMRLKLLNGITQKIKDKNVISEPIPRKMFTFKKKILYVQNKVITKFIRERSKIVGYVGPDVPPDVTWIAELWNLPMRHMLTNWFCLMHSLLLVSMENLLGV